MNKITTEQDLIEFCQQYNFDFRIKFILGRKNKMFSLVIKPNLSERADKINYRLNPVTNSYERIEIKAPPMPIFDLPPEKYPVTTHIIVYGVSPSDVMVAAMNRINEIGIRWPDEE